MLRYLTAGESHGKAIVALIDGFPAGLTIDTAPIDAELRRRQGGYGRGGRQRIETDTVDILSGVWQNVTLGSPIAVQVVNKDYKLERLEDLERPRPGHADLTGAIKYLGSIRAVLERASARETAVRVAVGAIAKQLLAQFGIAALGYVVELGGTKIDPQPGTIEAQRKLRDESIIYSLNPSHDDVFRQMIDTCGKDGDTLGGIVEVRVEGLPFGLGTHTQWDRKLDGRLAQAVMSIQAIKGVEIGLGFEAARRRGSHVHDPIQFDQSQRNMPNLGFIRPTNNAGGLEAGMTNGQPLVVRAAKKPISTLRKPLESVNLKTHQPETAQYERSDVCAVSAASVIVENVVAFEVAAALVDKFGGDSLAEMKARYDLFLKMAQEVGGRR
jgi:chorismate synthase